MQSPPAVVDHPSQPERPQKKQAGPKGTACLHVNAGMAKTELE